MLGPPPQPAIMAPKNINPASSIQLKLHARLRIRRASAKSVKASSAAIATGIQIRISGLSGKGGVTEFAVVARKTVTLSAAPDGLELTTNGLTGSLVPTEHEALGAFVVQVKNTKPVPLANPGMNLLVFATPLLSPAFTVIEGGAGNIGGASAADALYWRT